MFRAPIPENDAARLAALRKYAILDSVREQAYDDVTALAAFVCDAPFSTITLVDRERQWFKSEIGFGTQETGRSDGLCANAILQPGVTVIEDTLEDDCFCQNPFVLGGPHIRFYAGAPLITADGFALGTVCVFDTRPRSLDSRQIGALESLARQVMAHLELRLRLLDQERQEQALRTAEKLAVVGRMASSMAHEINNPCSRWMSAEAQARLFEPFYSTKGARGTGLGLWVSRGILDKHGAQIRVRSSTVKAKQGTVFSIFFPLESPGAKAPNADDQNA